MKWILTLSVLVNIFFFGYHLQKKIRKANIEKPEDIRRRCKVDVFKVADQKDGDIIFIGDSQVERCQWHELFNKSEIKNRGIGGDNTEGVLSRINEVLEQKPSKVFIMIGINDVIAKNTPEKIISTYQKIVEQIKGNSKSTEIYIHSILPVNNDIWPYNYIENVNIEGINSQLAQIPNSTFIDLYSKLTSEKGELDSEFTLDGLHLNKKAYLIWKNELIFKGILN